MSGYRVTIHDLVALVGTANAARLCDTFGGDELYIPKSNTLNSKSHPIVKAIGIESALKLSNEFSTERLQIPMAKAQVRASILQDVKDKKITRSKAAKQLNLTVRRVQQLVNGVDKETPQVDMFDSF